MDSLFLRYFILFVEMWTFDLTGSLTSQQSSVVTCACVFYIRMFRWCEEFVVKWKF